MLRGPRNAGPRRAWPVPKIGTHAGPRRAREARAETHRVSDCGVKDVLCPSRIAARRDARLLAQKHSLGLLMRIESEISRCGRDAGATDLRGAVLSSTNTDGGCAHKRHLLNAWRYQWAWNKAPAVAMPEIIEPAIAIAAGMPRGNSRLISPAMNIAATGRAITK